MIGHEVRTHPSARLAREDQLAWQLAAVAAEVIGMMINRVIDDAAVAAAALARPLVRAAREQALRHPTVVGRSGPGAVVWDAPGAHVSPGWAAWANGVAMRELDFHDTFLAAEYADELAELAIPGVGADAEQTETWGIL
jgi:2-methylcitrate dehydratase